MYYLIYLNAFLLEDLLTVAILTACVTLSRVTFKILIGTGSLGHLLLGDMHFESYIFHTKSHPSPRTSYSFLCILVI